MDLTEEEIRQIVHQRYKAKCKRVKELEAEVARLKEDNRLWELEVGHLRRSLNTFKMAARQRAERMRDPNRI